MSPCSKCKERGLECRVSLSSRKCGNCVRSGYRCDAQEVSARDFEKIDKERARLRAEKLAARERRLVEEARIARLEKLEELLESREGEMIRRGVANIEELERLEEQERAEAQKFASSAPTAVDSLASAQLDFDLIDPWLFGTSGEVPGTK
jgi:hypothetical protein